MSRLPERLVLIHGAWAGAWVWDTLIPELASRGLDATALDLPGDGFFFFNDTATTETDFHDTLRAAIEEGSGPVALVGHSGGGMLVTAGAQAWPERVSHGIWIAGMLIPDGRSFDDIQEDIMGKGGRFGITPHVQPSPCGQMSQVPGAAAIKHFLHDASPEQAAAAIARLTPQPAAGHRLRTPTSQVFDDLPKLYLLATQDRSVIPQAQQLMANSTPNLQLQPIDSGHIPQLTRPAELAEHIATWLSGWPTS